jgi:hypothetical protein
MRHTVRLEGVIIGHSELEHADPTLGRAWGALRPGLGYELVQPVFRLFAKAMQRDGSPNDDAMLGRYHKSRDALGLRLENAQGRTIATSAIHITDYTVEEGSGALVLEVLIKDERYWNERTAGA